MSPVYRVIRLPLPRLSVGVTAALAIVAGPVAVHHTGQTPPSPELTPIAVSDVWAGASTRLSDWSSSSGVLMRHRRHPAPTVSTSTRPSTPVTPAITSSTSAPKTSTSAPSPTQMTATASAPAPTAVTTPSSPSSSTSSTAAPIAAPPSAADPGWPSSATTGVPAGLPLATYSGPCVIRDGSSVVIDAKDVSSTCAALIAYSGSFVITRSKLPRVEAQWPGSVHVTDSDIWAGDQSVNSAAITYNVNSPTAGFNLVLSRVDIQGGKDSVECRGNCSVTDSYLHNQRSYGGAHIQGFLSSGGNHMVVRHNSIACDPPDAVQGDGCTADLALFGDLAQVNDVVVDNNRFLGGSYPAFCIYGGYQTGKAFPVSTNVQITNNLFELGPQGKCGRYGPVSSTVVGAGGTVWSGNVWETGRGVNASL